MIMPLAFSDSFMTKWAVLLEKPMDDRLTKRQTVSSFEILSVNDNYKSEDVRRAISNSQIPLYYIESVNHQQLLPC